jgi:hypothetical protein
VERKSVLGCELRPLSDLCNRNRHSHDPDRPTQGNRAGREAHTEVSATLAVWDFRGQDCHVDHRSEPVPALCAPVAAYIDATNALDLHALLATFADDALVNDQLQNYWGKAAIAEWAARDIIGARLTMYVVDVLKHYEHVAVTAHVDGDFDMRGLPDPLVLTFHFSPRGAQIVQLIILRNQAGI